MTTASVLDDNPGPYMLADLEAMPDDGRRFELIDGGLHVTPAPIRLHQRVAYRLNRLLNDAAVPGLEAVETIDVQCGPDTVLEPDVIVLPSSVVEDPDRFAASRHVALVVEIESSSSRRVDRFLKRQIYADAGIPTYLLVELTLPAVTWYGLSGVGRYAIRGTATGTEALRLAEPFEVDIVPDDLVRRYSGCAHS